MNDSMQPQFDFRLSSNERLIWSGQPRKGLLLRAGDMFVIPFSLIWGGFAIFWEITAINNGAPLPFALFGMVPLLIGLYLILGRFWFDAMQRAKTYYGVTNERVIIASGILQPSIKSFNIDSVPDMTLNEQSDGAGTIFFGPANPFQTWAQGMPVGNTQFMAPSFELIRDARKVYELIRSEQKKSKF